MKEFIIKDGPYISKVKDKSLPYIIYVLLIMVGYRLLKEGMIPYFKGEVTLFESMLPVFLISACILLGYGCFFVGNYFFKEKYKLEECFIDSMLLGLLLPLYTPIFLICITIFITIMIGRYFYGGKPFFSPALIGIVTFIGVSIFFSTFSSNSYLTKFIFEYKEIFSLESLSLSSIWIGFVEEGISKTSSLLCLLSFPYLILKKVIKWRIPVYFIISYFTILVFSNFIIPLSMLEIIKILGSNNFIFLSIFVATDQRTTPVTNSGQILFSVFLSLFTYLGSYFFTPFLSMIFGILIVNILVPIFDYFGNYYKLRFCNEFDIL